MSGAPTSHVLLLACGPFGLAAHGARFARRFADRLAPHATLTVRDLAADPLPPISQEYARGITSDTPFDADCFVVSETLVREIEQADLIVIATPMHNFTVPAALKLWIDLVLRIRRTFEGSPQGKYGLLRDRPVHVVVSSSGRHQGERANQPDFLSPYLRVALATMGLTQVEFVYLQGIGGDLDAVDAVLQEAQRSWAPR